LLLLCGDSVFRSLTSIALGVRKGDDNAETGKPRHYASPLTPLGNFTLVVDGPTRNGKRVRKFPKMKTDAFALLVAISCGLDYLTQLM